MSFYNMLFGMNPHSDLLLAVIGLKRNDVERFRDAHVSEAGATITVYSRTGGGNRSDYPNLTMRKRPEWQGSEDDDYDSTYCTDTFKVPPEWVEDVKALSDIMGNGIRREFAQHLCKTLRREATPDDLATKAYEQERQELARTSHQMANGHTFVPHDDSAMETALKIAEANGGKLRSCWGILPIKLRIQTDFFPYPGAKAESDRKFFRRVEVGYDYKWPMDEAYWKHCQERFSAKYPQTMASIAESVENHMKQAA